VACRSCCDAAQAAATLPHIPVRKVEVDKQDVSANIGTDDRDDAVFRHLRVRHCDDVERN
jgi:hypothetical protein